MNGGWVRRLHRWLSITFTLTVGLNLAALALGRETSWIGLIALFPLIALMLTGLGMFLAPHLARWSGRGRVEA